MAPFLFRGVLAAQRLLGAPTEQAVAYRGNVLRGHGEIVDEEPNGAANILTLERRGRHRRQCRFEFLRGGSHRRRRCRERGPASIKLHATILCGHRAGFGSHRSSGRAPAYGAKSVTVASTCTRLTENTNPEIRPGRPLMRRSMSLRETSGQDQNGPDSRAYIRAANTGGTRLAAGPFDGFPDVAGVKWRNSLIEVQYARG